GLACSACAGSCDLTSGRCVLTLTPGQDSPHDIAVDSASVYWTTTATVMKVPLGGGSATTLATPPSAVGIAIDSTSVYWTSPVGHGGSVMKVPRAGGTSTTLASTGQNPGGIAVDS